MFDPTVHPSLTAPQRALVDKVTAFTRQYFDSPRFDSSHDFAHVLRVTCVATKLLDAEQKRRQSQGEALLDPLVVILGGLLHDVGDRKYVAANNGAKDEGEDVRVVLWRLSGDEALASRVAALVEGVSYSSERKNPQRVRDLLVTIPELGVVQDADRIDALGAIGVGRLFTYGAIHGARSLQGSVDHIEEKLVRLEGMAKTVEGRRRIEVVTERIRRWRGEWEEEMAFAGADG